MAAFLYKDFLIATSIKSSARLRFVLRQRVIVAAFDIVVRSGFDLGRQFKPWKETKLSSPCVNGSSALLCWP
jgi:hypothetical protein